MKQLAVFIGIACGLGAISPAQELTATLSGSVFDTSGGVVPNAPVTVLNAATRVVAWQGRTSEAGVYAAPALDQRLHLQSHPDRARRVDGHGHADQSVLGRDAQIGTLGRNTLRLPGEVNMDLAVARAFPIFERARIELRAEAFNLFNHTNLEGPSTSLSVQADPRTGQAIFNSPGFGLITAAKSARFMQLVARLEF